MAQKNYFTYNIIDSIYFNKPTGQDLYTVYGIGHNFVRRNEDAYASMTPEEKAHYDEEEKKFIQAVINKYVMDDFGNGSYIDVMSNTDQDNINSKITYAYFKTRNEIGIELSDMLTNINGVHNYKLLSAKDIDFDNIILPNSAVTRDFNWGGFDINRRWGDKPIHINNTFELLNVIDYLLCACDNLWNELYNLKYSINESVQIWFTKNVADTVLIHNSKALTTNDFQLDKNGNPMGSSETRMITYLDPTNYYTSLNNNVENNFGVVTNFYKTDDDHDVAFDRRIVDIRNRNIILMVILPSSKEIRDYVSTTTQNVNNQLTQIYAYKIGDELKIYPGSSIDTFTNDNNVIIYVESLVDFTNKKLKKDTYFKTDFVNSVYSKVYIKFLNANNLGLSYNVKNPFIIYYMNEGQKIILSAGYQDMGESAISTDILNEFTRYINNNHIVTYTKFDLNNNIGDSVHIMADDTCVPKFYVMSDEFYTTLEVSTPNSAAFSAASKSITIYYYKNTNQLNCTITKKNKNGEDVEIVAEEDTTQRGSISYNNFRYNIPAGETVKFKFDATYIALNNENPLNLKLDDEYNDIMLFNLNVNNDDEAGKYYKLNNVDTTGLFKRNFEQFTKETFDSNKENYISIDSNSKQYKHIWKKNENPYQLSYEIDNDELIVQSLPRNEVVAEINKIHNNELIQTSYNTYELSHELTDGVEQVKLDLRFTINETSKVKSVEKIIPLNINKIYYPTINYYTYNAVIYENNKYEDIIYKDNLQNETSLARINRLVFNKYNISPSSTGLNTIPNIYQMMNNSDISSLDDLQDPKSYDCTVSNSYFAITYNSNKNIINLIGSYFVDIKYASKLANINLSVNNNPNTYIINNDSKHPYIFNINGLGKNYRLHGNGSIVDDVWSSGEVNKIKKYYCDFDLLSVATINDNVSFNKQLQFKLNDDNYQITYICNSSIIENNNNINIWTKNDVEFSCGVNIITQSQSNNDTQFNNDYQLNTIPVNIYKTTYVSKCTYTFNNSAVNQEYVTYNVPIVYMAVNSSTFYPPKNIIPVSYTWDINNADELEQYKNYVSCWDESHYRPITLSMKLFENTSISNPYYYESNEAVMKFNVYRSNESNPETISGSNNIIWVGLNAKYYMSDFINVGLTSSQLDIISNGSSSVINELVKHIPSGSYMYYNNITYSYVINEIPCNFSHTTLNVLNNHNNHYKNIYQNVEINNKLQTPERSGADGKVIYPIFYKPIIEKNENEEITNITYSTTSYNYDIYRISDINKLKFDSANNRFIYEVQCITGTNETNNYANLPSGNGATCDGIISNPETFTIDINNDFVNNFADNKAQGLADNVRYYFNIIKYNINHVGFHGSKNYTGTTAATTGIQLYILPIIRKRNNNHPDELKEMYKSVKFSGDNTTETTNGVYEFFEFKYNNICEIKATNNPNSPEYKSLAPGKNLDIYKAYNEQLKIFLKNDPNDLIATDTYYNNMYSNNSTIDNIEEG